MKIKSFKTTSYYCCNCKKHFATIADLWGLGEEECPYCGNTSFFHKKGRIISKKSIYYKKLLEDCKNIPLLQLKTYINE